MAKSLADGMKLGLSSLLVTFYLVTLGRMQIRRKEIHRVGEMVNCYRLKCG